MASPAIDWTSVDVLSFDCYGTLIDWERGILATLRPLFAAVGRAATDDTLLEAYAAHEARLEAGSWRLYREVLSEALAATCADYGVAIPSDARQSFAGSVADWPAFDDSAAALARLGTRFDLAVITNCDDDLFAYSNDRLGRPFRWVVTAEQVRSYKPAPRGFEVALERIGMPAERVVHVAQSLFHDHVPATALGLRTVCVNRRHERDGFGATPAASATPTLVVPDMATLADLAGC